MTMAPATDAVRSYWESEPCGTGAAVVGGAVPGTREWFDRTEDHRYRTEPFVHAVAQFTRHRGRAVLEIGVGAGVDHLQFARAGAVCHGVDLTDAAVAVTRSRLDCYGLTSDLRQADAERLPFADATFDLVYSWGVIHHAPCPERVIAEAYRVLKPGGEFVGMMYNRRSVLAFKVWVRHALLCGRPWRSMRDVLWHHVESPGTQAYTVRELQRMFGAFASFEATPILTLNDTHRWPHCVSDFFPRRWGWFIAIRAGKA